MIYKLKEKLIDLKLSTFNNVFNFFYNMILYFLKIFKYWLYKGIFVNYL